MPDELAPGPAPPSVRRRRIRWGAVGGLAALVYVVLVALDALVLAADGGTYTDLHRHLDGPVARSVLAVLVVGCLVHVLDGGRRLLVEGRGRPGLDQQLRLVVTFLVGALGVPLVVAVLWPWLEGVL